MKRAIISAIVIGILSVASTGSAQSGSFSADDYIEIQQLYAKYAHTLDLGDAEGWANTFTPDGVFGESQGHDQLKAFAEGFMGSFEGQARHWNTQLVITPTADGADGSCYLLLVDSRTQPYTIMAAGLYQDTVVKTSAGWRFQERVFTQDPQPGSD
ncbi:MAG: nuclear transport factor 2 family protein [Acidobacteria bacterium]|nr:nuclear transport factor 2 family protein [Acidobacteriota bacterium]